MLQNFNRFGKVKCNLRLHCSMSDKRDKDFILRLDNNNFLLINNCDSILNLMQDDSKTLHSEM